MLSSHQSHEVLGIGVLRPTTGCLQLLKPDHLQKDRLETVVVGKKNGLIYGLLPLDPVVEFAAWTAATRTQSRASPLVTPFSSSNRSTIVLSTVFSLSRWSQSSSALLGVSPPHELQLLPYANGNRLQRLHLHQLHKQVDIHMASVTETDPPHMLRLDCIDEPLDV